jgi:hypothetical protein
MRRALPAPGRYPSRGSPRPDERERKGSAVANFAIDLLTGGGRRQQHRDDQFTRLQHSFDMRRVAGWAVKRINRDSTCRAVGGDSLHHRVERRHRHRHVGRMRRDAVVAHTEHGVHPIEAFQRRAARSGHALIAGLRRVIEVGATRALQQIAPGRRLVAKLGRRAGENRLREQRVTAADAHVDGDRAVGDQRANPQAALRRLLDAIKRQPTDVDELRRRLDLQLHEVDEIRASGDELGRRLGGRCAGGRDLARPFVAERRH